MKEIFSNYFAARIGFETLKTTYFLLQYKLNFDYNQTDSLITVGQGLRTGLLIVRLAVMKYWECHMKIFVDLK